jgi:hypothetical protein
MMNKLLRHFKRIPGGRRSQKAAGGLAWAMQVAWLKRRGLRRMALASFPRSGNTWFRLFLEASTCRTTGNARRDQAAIEDPVERLVRSEREAGVEGLEDDIAIKTHGLDSHRYTHAIHLVRSPFDVLDSFYDWKAAGNWEWKHGPLEWEPFVEIVGPMWREHTRHWLDSRCKTYRVRYEDCRLDPVSSFGSLLSWMGVKVSEAELAQAIEATAFNNLKESSTGEPSVRGKFFRRGQVGRGLDRFSPAQQRWMVRLARRELLDCGYKDLVARIEAGEMPKRQEQE